MDKRTAANKARARPLAERLTEKYDMQDDGCWRWIGATNRDGYGHIMVNGRVASAHRVAYELHVGVIAPGEHVHHLCAHRWCVNPDHLVLVTQADHAIIEWRTFVCKHGHPRARSPRGRWVCPTCQAEASRRYYERKRVEA